MEKQEEPEPVEDLTPHGISLEQMKTDPMVLELAMLRVRHRHEDAGDIHKLKFGDLLHEARAEAQATYERHARGEERYLLGRRK